METNEAMSVNDGDDGASTGTGRPAANSIGGISRTRSTRTDSGGTALRIKKKSSMKSYKSRAESATSVHFNEEVTVRSLPQDEFEEAIETRKGPWESAPPVDVLWDGEGSTFWERELTTEELQRRLMVRSLRSTLLFNLGFAFNGELLHLYICVFALYLLPAIPILFF